MRNEAYYPNSGSNLGDRLADMGVEPSRKTAVGVILIVALFAFEIFNFDTTRYALRDLLGGVEFLTFEWASILAIAFCSIDFAGLVRIFTPERGMDEPKEVWYLMGAWLLGATMNAVMTWWAVSLTLLNNDFGNEIMSREQLLQIVPIFVAVLVWITRILFIGAFSVAGEHIFDFYEGDEPSSPPPPPRSNNKRAPARKEPVRTTTAPQRQTTRAPRQPAALPRQTQSRANKPQAKRSAPKALQPSRPRPKAQPKPKPKATAQPVQAYPTDDVPDFLEQHDFDDYFADMPQQTLLPTQKPMPNQNPRAAKRPSLSSPKQQPTSRVRQRPSKPTSNAGVRRVTPPRNNNKPRH